MHKILTAVLLLCSLSSGAQKAATSLLYPDEKHFKNMRQLTNGGDNAEAYFGFDNEHITFQRTNTKEGVSCDQIGAHFSNTA